MPTLIRNGVVLPMAAPGGRLDPGSVLVDGAVIVAVDSVEALDADPRSAGADVVDATGHAVIPGLHNCHLHSGLLRGTAESMSLWDWLKAYVDPAHKALTPEIAEAASLHCYAESVLAGTVSVMDMWRHMEGSAAVIGDPSLSATDRNPVRLANDCCNGRTCHAICARTGKRSARAAVGPGVRRTAYGHAVAS